MPGRALQLDPKVSGGWSLGSRGGPARTAASRERRRARRASGGPARGVGFGWSVASEESRARGVGSLEQPLLNSAIVDPCHHRGANMAAMATSYDSEPVDRLPFGSAEKAARYATERYLGATGLNWWRCDPTLQFLMRYHLTRRRAGVGRAAPRPHRRADGRARVRAGRAHRQEPAPARALRPVGPRRQRGRAAAVVPRERAATSSTNSFTTPADPRGRRTRTASRLTMLNAAHSYMLNQAEIGMTCALGTGGDMVVNLVRAVRAGRHPRTRAWRSSRRASGRARRSSR